MADYPPDYTRRTSDASRMEIETLIAAEDDPAKRVQLLVLQSINTSLQANTHLTMSVSEDLKAHKAEFQNHIKAFAGHAQREEAMINKGKGAWTVAAWIIGLAQLVAIGLWQQSRSDMAQYSEAIQSNHVALARIDTRLVAVEKEVGKAHDK